MTDVDYRSPFRTWLNFGDSAEFGYWIDRREAYTKGDDGALVTMLHYVTIDNPPDAPKRRVRSWRPGWFDVSLGVVLTAYVLTVAFITVVALVFS